MTRSYGTDTIRKGALAGPFSRNYKLEDERYGASGYTNLGFDTGTLSHSLTVGGDFSIGKSTQSFTGDDACIRGVQSPTCAFCISIKQTRLISTPIALVCSLKTVSK
ncbi:hypothetical protein HED51_15060 [Ochrobactrum grignonense]|nr:hypothetical protein [Brucella grignonensis]